MSHQLLQRERGLCYLRQLFDLSQRNYLHSVSRFFLSLPKRLLLILSC